MAAPIIQIRDAVVARLTEFGASEDAALEFVPEAALFPSFDKEDSSLKVLVIGSGLSVSSAARDTDAKSYTIDIGVFQPVPKADEFEDIEELVELVEQILSFLRSDAGGLHNPSEGAEWTAVEAHWDDEQPNNPVLYDQGKLRDGLVFVSQQSVAYKYYSDREGE